MKSRKEDRESKENKHTLHGSNATHLEHQPAHHLVVQARPVLVREGLVLVVQVGQIQHDGAGLEDAQIPILERRDASVGVDVEEPLLLLLVGRDVDGARLVRQAELLEHDGRLEPVGRAERVVGQLVVWRRRHVGGR